MAVKGRVVQSVCDSTWCQVLSPTTAATGLAAAAAAFVGLRWPQRLWHTMVFQAIVSFEVQMETILQTAAPPESWLPKPDSTLTFPLFFLAQLRLK